MKTTIKFIICAVLSLLIGIGCAAPLLVAELDVVPYPIFPLGPKADFNVSTVYANFTEKLSSVTYRNEVLTSVNYQIILNVTNLSNLSATVASLNWVVARNATVTQGIIGSVGVTGGDSLSIVRGLWLDGKWLNVTWIPGTYPDGLGQITAKAVGEFDRMLQLNSTSTLLKTVPDLPANASYTGYWMEGVPVDEYSAVNDKTGTVTIYDAVFINGSWVDVTGRVKAEYPQQVISAGCAVGLFFDSENYGAYRSQNALDQAMTVNNTFLPDLFKGDVDKWAGQGGFNATWAPHQSRLIMLNGTFLADHSQFAPLTNGATKVYAALLNYVYDHPINGTYYDTFSTAVNQEQIALQAKADGYIYNGLLSEKESYVIDPFGVEVYIEPAS